MDSPVSCKTSAYVAPMVIVLILLVAILVFGIWYYFSQLKPRLTLMVMDKMSGAVGLKDATGAQLVLSPPPRDVPAAANQSSRIAVINPVGKSNLDFALFTVPIAGNSKNQVQMIVQNAQGAGSLQLTAT